MPALTTRLTSMYGFDGRGSDAMMKLMSPLAIRTMRLLKKNNNNTHTSNYIAFWEHTPDSTLTTHWKFWIKYMRKKALSPSPTVAPIGRMTAARKVSTCLHSSLSHKANFDWVFGITSDSCCFKRVTSNLSIPCLRPLSEVLYT